MFRYDEPTDLRSILCSLIIQMLPDHTLPTFISRELDIQKIKKYFKETYHSCCRNRDSLLVIVIDNLDRIDSLTYPSTALKINNMGVNIWDLKDTGPKVNTNIPVRLDT